MNERTRSVWVLIAGAVAAGVYLGVQRAELERPRPHPSAVPSASAVPAASALPASPARAASRAEIERTIATLERGVRAGASDAKSPWALAHGMVAFGAELVASDGRPAIDVIAGFAELGELGGKKLWLFPETRDGAPVEPHRFLLAKTLLEADVPLTRPLTTSTRARLTLSRLVDDLHRAAALPQTDADYHQVAWLLSSLVEHARRQPAEAAKAPGPSVAELTRVAVERLESDHRVIATFAGTPERAFDEGSPLRQAKTDKTGIYGHSCGGLHLVQAVLAGAAASRDDQLASRARKQLGVLLRRYELERGGYAALLRAHPDQGLLLRVQQLKFFGHLVETLTLARSLGVYDPTNEGGRRLDGVIRSGAADVADVVAELAAGGIYERLDAIRKEREQTYLDLIGDGCHAIRGLRRALVLV